MYDFLQSYLKKFWFEVWFVFHKLIVGLQKLWLTNCMKRVNDTFNSCLNLQSLFTVITFLCDQYWQKFSMVSVRRYYETITVTRLAPHACLVSVHFMLLQATISCSSKPARPC